MPFVTPDTEFGIGSATKAFTALSVLMSVDEGKVNLEDSPKKYLPYFKMKDAETDKKMNVRDLMDHSNGFEPNRFSDDNRKIKSSGIDPNGW